MTGVSNHRYFQDQLRRELAAPTSVGLIIFDVDHFKTFNDRFGHPEGDQLLKWIARSLVDLSRGHGFVSRYGGEEFTLVLPNAGQSEALTLADRILKYFEGNAFTGEGSTSTLVTMSAGLAIAPAHGKSPRVEANVLIESADRALYQAKREGRNQVAVASVR